MSISTCVQLPSAGKLKLMFGKSLLCVWMKFELFLVYQLQAHKHVFHHTNYLLKHYITYIRTVQQRVCDVDAASMDKESTWKIKHYLRPENKVNEKQGIIVVQLINFSLFNAT